MRDGPLTLDTLPGGLRFVSENVPQAESVALGLWLPAGPRYESPETSGLSHFLEHCLFKGAGQRDTRQLALEADELGGDLEALTEREATVIELRVLPEDLERGVSLLFDLAFRPWLPAEDLELEKQVVLQERKMAEDRPSDVLGDLLLERMWPDHPFGYPILGREEVLLSCDAACLRDFHRARYFSSGAVLAAAGPHDPYRLLSLAQAALPNPSPAQPPEPCCAPPTFSAGDWLKPRDFEQVHVALAAPCPPAADDARYALALLDNILGGSVSSRLFQAVREERGLAYAVGSSLSLFRNAGMVVIHFSTEPELAVEALRAVAREMRRLRLQGVTEDELVRAKQQARRSLALSLESNMARAGRLAKNLLLMDRILPLREALDRLEAVTSEQTWQWAERLLVSESLTMAVVGPVDNALWRDLRAVREDL